MVVLEKASDGPPVAVALETAGFPLWNHPDAGIDAIKAVGVEPRFAGAGTVLTLDKCKNRLMPGRSSL